MLALPHGHNICDLISLTIWSRDDSRLLTSIWLIDMAYLKRGSEYSCQIWPLITSAKEVIMFSPGFVL